MQVETLPQGEGLWLYYHTDETTSMTMQDLTEEQQFINAMLAAQWRGVDPRNSHSAQGAGMDRGGSGEAGYALSERGSGQLGVGTTVARRQRNVRIDGAGAAGPLIGINTDDSLSRFMRVCSCGQPDRQGDIIGDSHGHADRSDGVGNSGDESPE